MRAYIVDSQKFEYRGNPSKWLGGRLRADSQGTHMGTDTDTDSIHE